MSKKLNYIDLFAGAGGLSEGFSREGYNAVAHVETDIHACATLKTRLAYHYYKEKHNLNCYYNYLRMKTSREELLGGVPSALLDSVIHEEISQVNLKPIYSKIDELTGAKEIDLIIGGPPCQAYSLVGRSRDPNRMVGDSRNYLFRYYAKFLERYEPRYFVFENVLGLLTAGSKSYLNEMRQLFKLTGYETSLDVLNAEDYGVLQRRRRVVIIGRRGNKPFDFPRLTTTENNWQIQKDLFADLPPLRPGNEMPIVTYSGPTNSYLTQTETRNGLKFTTQHITRKHTERDLEIYSIAVDRWLKDRIRLKYSELPTRLQTHKNVNGFLDRFKVIDPLGHSHTLMAHIAKDGHYYIYPDPKQIRSISVREAARIQSFPDNYYFEGGRTAAFRQIGNAVPPLVAQAIAKALKEEMK